MAFNAGPSLLFTSSWPQARERRRDYAISAGCDAEFLSSGIFSDHADASTDGLTPLFFFVELFHFLLPL